MRSRSYRYAQYIEDYQRARPCDRSFQEYGNMAIWNSCNIDIPRSLNSRDGFLRMKFENRTPKSCRLGTVLSWSIISFELHAKILERIDLEKCNFRQFSEMQKPRDLDLDLDLGLGQGHIDMHSTCRTTSMPNRVTVASRSTEIWLFEFREISTFREAWTSVIAFVGLLRAISQVPCYHYQPSVFSSTPKWRRT